MNNESSDNYRGNNTTMWHGGDNWKKNDNQTEFGNCSLNKKFSEKEKFKGDLTNTTTNP